ncbi:hypothetical protein ABZ814_05545 [Micromonospora musae]|uniref:hypothetical protein n=1 Tax=Micromonospora musae TaxID=1894970 RepID=UPI0033EF2FF1
MDLNTGIDTTGTAGRRPHPIVLASSLLLALSGLALLALALANLGGRNWTRIVTWSLGGVTLAFSGFSLALTLLPLEEGGTVDTTDWASVHALAAQLSPGWAEPVGTVSGFVASPALVVALVLLALPAANAFYRRRRTSPYEPLIRYPDTTLPQPTGRR